MKQYVTINSMAHCRVFCTPLPSSIPPPPTTLFLRPPFLSFNLFSCYSISSFPSTCPLLIPSFPIYLLPLTFLLSFSSYSIFSSSPSLPSISSPPTPSPLSYLLLHSPSSFLSPSFLLSLPSPPLLYPYFPSISSLPTPLSLFIIMFVLSPYFSFAKVCAHSYRRSPNRREFSSSGF